MRRRASSNLGNQAGQDRIWASCLGFYPQDWDLDLKAGILASRLGFGPQGWDLGLKAGMRLGGVGFNREGGEKPTSRVGGKLFF